MSKDMIKSAFALLSPIDTFTYLIFRTPVLEPRLFKTNTSTFSFKFKSIFRSKQSLAEEMKKALNESESQLQAFIIRGYELQKVPHSAFHSLEATHVRTILSQLNDNSWYKTFVTMTSDETEALMEAMSANPLVRPSGGAEKEVVVLKVVDHKMWAAVKDLLRKNAGSPHDHESKRVLLAIVREKLVAAQSTATPLGISRPQPLVTIQPKHLVLRQPPGLPIPRGSNNRICDLRYPSHLPTFPGWHVSYPSRTALVGYPVQKPPSLTAPGTSNRPKLPVIDDPNIRTGAPDDFAADRALRVYTEYTLRQADYPASSPHHPNPPKSWQRVSITQESNPRSHLLARIASFRASGGNAIEIKLRLSEHQSTQISRLLDEIKNMERDARFDWSWVEISLYTHSGVIATSDLMRTDQDVPFNFAPTATHMHLIAERALRPQYAPLEVFSQFMKEPENPFVVSPPVPLGPLGPPPIPVQVSGPPRIVNVIGGKKTKKNYSSSSDSGGESSGYSTDDSIGVVRRKMRLNRARR